MNASENVTVVAPITEQFSIFHQEIHLWTGQCKFEDDEFQLGEGGQLPPQDLRKALGSKWLIEPSVLKPFVKLKQKAMRTLSKYGVSFLGNFAVPNDKVDLLIDEMKEIKAMFYDNISALELNFQHKVSQWAARFPEFEEKILESTKEISPSGKYFFDFKIFQINSGNDEGFEQFARDSLARNLLKDINHEAKRLIPYFEGGNVVSAGTKKSLINMKNKVNSLLFIDHGFEKVADLLEKAITQYDYKVGRDLFAPYCTVVENALRILSTSKSLMDFLEKHNLPMLEGECAESDTNQLELPIDSNEELPEVAHDSNVDESDETQVEEDLTSERHKILPSDLFKSRSAYF